MTTSSASQFGQRQGTSYLLSRRERRAPWAGLLLIAALAAAIGQTPAAWGEEHIALATDSVPAQSSPAAPFGAEWKPLNDRAIGTVLPGEELELVLRFWENEVEVTGAVRSQDAAESLRALLTGIRPDSDLWERDLFIDEHAPALPEQRDLQALISELSVSSHFGKLRLAFGTLSISGFAESEVSRAALDIRIARISEKMDLQAENRIVVMDKDDLIKPSERFRRLHPPAKPVPPQADPFASANFPMAGPDHLSRRARMLIGRLQGIPEEAEALPAAYEDIKQQLGAEALLCVQFRSSSSQLTPGDAGNIRQLIRSQGDDLRNIRYLVIGYASIDGNPETNRLLSSARAATVASTINNAAGENREVAETFYFGQTQRFDPWRKRPNRSVEIWAIPQGENAEEESPPPPAEFFQASSD